MDAPAMSRAASATTGFVRARIGTVARALIGDVRRALRALARARGFTASALFSLALGGGLGAAVFALFRPERLFPPRWIPAAEVEPIRPGEWGATWSAAAETAAQIQQAGLDGLLRILGAVAALTLAVACINLAILLVSRASARRSELAVRAALGAPRWRFLLPLLAEGALLALVGGGLGALLGGAGMGLLHLSWPDGLRPWTGPGSGAWTALLALGAPMAATLACSLGPGLAAWRAAELRAALVTGGRATAEPREIGVRNGLAAGLFAGALTLLAGAGLLTRNATPLHEPAALGFEPEGVFTAQLDLPEAGYAEDDARAALYAALLERIAALPGVAAESIASPGAPVGLGTVDRVLVQCGRCSVGGLYTPLNSAVVQQHVVGPGFFDTLGVPLLDGREFTAEDRTGAARVAVVNRTFAHHAFERGDPVGRKIRVGDLLGPWYTVVGVVGDVHARGIGMGAAPIPALYLSALQHPPRSATLAVRAGGETVGDPLALAPAVRRIVAQLDPEPALYGTATMTEELVRFAAPLRWLGVLFTGLAGFGLALAAHGLYAVMGENVARRRREIGTRMALGARGRDILGMVVRRSARIALIGAALGLAGALTVARGLQLRFYGVKLFDPALYGALVLLLGAAALLGSIIPARRAARGDPAVPLREG